jgi:hypothetical protein
LREAGPPDDRSILLQGQVAIGQTHFLVTAVRVDPIRFGPDFRTDRNVAIYANYELSGLLDMVSELAGASEPSTLQLETGRYVMWMLPEPSEA